MDKSYVSMGKKICPICGKEHETNAILLNKYLHKNMDKYTTTGWGHCEDCQKKINEGYVALVEAKDNGEKTVKPQNADRTGHIAWLKQEACDRIFDMKITTSMVFIQVGVIEQLESMIPYNN